MASPNDPESLADFLVRWSRAYDISEEALTELLVYLNNTSFPDLPRNAQTLLCAHAGNNVGNVVGSNDDASSGYADDDVNMDETDGGFCDDDGGTLELAQPLLPAEHDFAFVTVKLEMEDPLHVPEPEPPLSLPTKVIVVGPRKVDRYAERILRLRRLHHLDIYQFKKTLKMQHTDMMRLCALYDAANAKRATTLLNLFKQLQTHCAAAAAESLENLRAVSNLRLTLVSIKKYGCAIVTQSNFQAPAWPFTTAAEVLEFNTNLKEPEFHDQVLHRMLQWRCTIPGNLRKTIKQYLDRMIHCSTIVEFSWTGKIAPTNRDEKKRKFSELAEILTLMYDLLGNHQRSEVLNQLRYCLKRMPQYYNNALKKQKGKSDRRR